MKTFFHQRIILPTLPSTLPGADGRPRRGSGGRRAPRSTRRALPSFHRCWPCRPPRPVHCRKPLGRAHTLLRLCISGTPRRRGGRCTESPWMCARAAGSGSAAVGAASLGDDLKRRICGEGEVATKEGEGGAATEEASVRRGSNGRGSEEEGRERSGRRRGYGFLP
jgi:hypothetical protein